MADETTGADALALNLSATAASYDSLPYTDTPIYRTHPSRMAAVARLFGLETPPAAKARVLELGCGCGGNLIALAAYYPEARFTGVELSAEQVEHGRRRIAKMGLDNIELLHASITDFDSRDEEYDYIVTHGVYSWVPPEVQASILDISQKMLAPEGLAYVSYNVLPGWRTCQPVRDALRLMVPPGEPAATRAAKGRGIIQFLAENTPEQGAYADILKGMHERLDGYPNSYLYHEYMEEVNEPCAVGTFTDAAFERGLAYLGEGELKIMFPDGFGEEFVRKLNSMTSDNLVSHQQMLDILVGTEFRASLLCHKKRMGEIDRSIASERIEDMHFMPGPHIRQERTEEGYAIRTNAGHVRNFDDADVVALLDRVIGEVPGTTSYDECIEGFEGEAQMRARSLLWKMMTNGILAPSVEPLQCGAVSNRPVATAMARCDAELRLPITATRTHNGVSIETLPLDLIALCDGSRTRDDLVRVVGEAILSGEARQRDDTGGGAPPDPARVVDEGLRAIAAHGLLEA